MNEEPMSWWHLQKKDLTCWILGRAADFQTDDLATHCSCRFSKNLICLFWQITLYYPSFLAGIQNSKSSCTMHVHLGRAISLHFTILCVLIYNKLLAFTSFWSKAFQSWCKSRECCQCSKEFIDHLVWTLFRFKFQVFCFGLQNWVFWYQSM